jgi:hypothetical protein
MGASSLCSVCLLFSYLRYLDRLFNAFVWLSVTFSESFVLRCFHCGIEASGKKVGMSVFARTHSYIFLAFYVSPLKHAHRP